MFLFCKVVDSITDWIGRLSSYLLIPLMLIITFEAIMRYWFRHPTIWAWDLNIQIFAGIVMLSGAYSLLKKGHVGVDVLVLNMNTRKKAILDLFTSFFFFIGLVVLLIGGTKMALMSLKVHETMPTVWGPPYYYMKMLVPLGALLVTIQCKKLKKTKKRLDKGFC